MRDAQHLLVERENVNQNILHEATVRIEIDDSKRVRSKKKKSIMHSVATSSTSAIQ